MGPLSTTFPPICACKDHLGRGLTSCVANIIVHRGCCARREQDGQQGQGPEGEVRHLVGFRKGGSRGRELLGMQGSLWPGQQGGWRPQDDVEKRGLDGDAMDTSARYDDTTGGCWLAT